MKLHIVNVLIFLVGLTCLGMFFSCGNEPGKPAQTAVSKDSSANSLLIIDTNEIPHDKFGDEVRYGQALMYNTAYYIGPNGINGKYLGNKMNCTNCHQNAGTKPYSFNLISSHSSYPQYRAREGKVLDLAERVNNCIMRPHNGKPLPLDSHEMIAFLSYLKWINSYLPAQKHFAGSKNLEVKFPMVAADPLKGEVIYKEDCARCHGADGAGLLRADSATYVYPPLWGKNAFQPGSSMHRVIKSAQWIKANMPFDKSTYKNPVLTDEEALDVAAFMNNDAIHQRPEVKSFDYPHIGEKAIDYDRGPFVDSFTVAQHKYGPYPQIIEAWKAKGMKPVY